MRLDGPQLAELQAALIDAFPTHSDLEQMVLYGLSVHLGAVTAQGSLQQIVFELLRWAVAQGRLEELIKTAIKQNSENQDLKRVTSQLAIPHNQMAPRYWNIPYLRNPFFTGQEELLDELAEALSKKRRASLSQGITGLGGIGKTQIAVEYAHRYQQEYQAVLWVFAETRESLISGYMAIAQLLGLREKNEQDQAVIVEAVKSWLQTTCGSWLMIFDNVDDFSLVSEFLPSRFDGQILFTTRAQSMGGLAECIEVKTMSLDVGALLLLRRARLVARDACLSDALVTDVVMAKTICEELGGLPLALDQAGAYLEETQCGLGSYLDRYRKRRAVLLARRGGQLAHHPDPVAETLSLSLEKVELQSAEAADLLRLCAFLAPDAIAEEIITQGAAHFGPSLALVAEDDVALDEAIASLLAYSLVRRNVQEKTLSVHRLVQAVLTDAMDEQTRRRWAESVVLAVNSVFPDEAEFETWPQCERCLPHALVGAGLMEQYQIKTEFAARLLNAAAYYLHDRARYTEAEPLLQRALSIYEEQLGPTHPNTASSLNNLAELYRVQGKYEKSELLYQRALAIWEEQLGPTHPNTASSLNNLAELYRVQGKYEKSELLYQRALAIWEEQLGPTHSHTASSLNNLAALYYEQGKYEKSEPLLQRALSIYEEHLGPMHPNTAQSLNNLAALYYVQGKYSLAELLFQRVLSMREEQLGESHPDTAISLNNLASLYWKQGEYAKAESLYQRALSIREEQLGESHPDTAQSLHNLATLYERQEKYSLAEPLFRRALTIFEQELGLDHPSTQKTRQWYVDLLKATGRDEEAASLENAVSNEGATEA